jgi:hypothetical protein
VPVYKHNEYPFFAPVCSEFTPERLSILIVPRLDPSKNDELYENQILSSFTFCEVLVNLTAKRLLYCLL